MGLSAIALSGALPFPKPLALLGGCASGALGYGVLFLGWSSLYSTLPSSEAIAHGTFSFVLHAFINMMLGVFSFEAKTATMVLIPFISVYCLHVSLKKEHQPQTQGRYYERGDYAAFWKIGLGIFLYGLLLGMRKGLNIHVDSPYLAVLVQILSICFYLAIAVWVIRFKRQLDFSRLVQILLIVFATGFLLYPLMDEAQSGYIAGIFSLAVALIYIFIWMGAVDIARHSHMHPGIIIGAVWFLYSAPRLPGAALSDLLSVHGEPYYSFILSLALVYCVVIISAFLLGSYPLGIRRIFEPEEGQPAIQEYLSIDERCDELAEKAHLTERETDIMKLLCKGRTKGYIAETLFISENTVKSYTKNLYAKLGVHRKESLLDLLERQ